MYKGRSGVAAPNQSRPRGTSNSSKKADKFSYAGSRPTTDSYYLFSQASNYKSVVTKFLTFGARSRRRHEYVRSRQWKTSVHDKLQKGLIGACCVLRMFRNLFSNQWAQCTSLLLPHHVLVCINCRTAAMNS